MKLVSIIIPIYNVEKYIVKCLESVFSQTYKNIEIILVNDCTPDNSIPIINDYLNNLSNYFETKIIHHSINKGLSESRNTGVKNSNGEYIYFLDSDDWISNDSIELLLNSSIKYNSDVAIGGTICYLENEKIEKVIFPLLNTKKFLKNNEEVFTAFMNHEWPVIAPNKIYKKSFLEKNNLHFKPNLLGEDELWAFEWALCAEKVSFVNENTYYYFLRSNSIISSKTKKNFDDMFFILSVFTKFYNNEKNKFKKISLKKYILYYKEMILMMQWKALSSDRKYFYQNYKKLKKYPYLNLIELLSNNYTITQKKKSLLFHLPTLIGAPFYIKRYER
ncbi:glycosyltransferase family 2 protein [Chishuiella sp.]|uniref:glycosyltransferase family 2 protein n=1 Tax=Chishuiella sp. TaxID=1969467 RepID=UPI0028A62685|nr:glycosyltransferase [Chishuiella sp.]